MLNIGGDQHDRSYRYKMSPLITKIEGRGNGIKTVLVNMSDVAKQLHIDAAYPTKYFGIELGAQTKWNAATERAVVNGAHQNSDMQAILHRFIAAFILCPTCSLPELRMKIRKRGITIDCAACGNNSVIPGGHRLVGYMIKHYEKKKKERAADGGKKKRKDKNRRREKRQEETKTEETKETQSVAAAAPKKEISEEWHTDTSSTAQAMRRKKEYEKMDHANPKVTAILKAAALENKENSCTTLLQIFLVSKEELTVREIVSEMRRLQIAHSLDDPKAIKVLLESVLSFEDIKTIPAQFSKHAELFSYYTAKSSIIFLGCVEELVGVIEPRLLSRTPMILKALFDAEVLTEEAILQWYDMSAESSWLVNKQVAVKVRQKAEPLVEWLRSSEGSDEESDEDSDEEA